ncbi:MAG: trypsin-like peptidase domain-containing protein [Bacteroidaceae bacterium]|nr:trypsin-like peptidase domain-containing protein [Bacteroidaceae bacterium]
MKKATRIIAFSLTLICCCVLASVITTNLVNKRNTVYIPGDNAPYTTLSQASMPSAGKMQPVDLTEAAEKTVHGVVHIKATVKSRTQTYQEIPDFIEQFMFGARPRQRQYQTQPQVGYGSGVILTKDGYIVTNNHVIEKADEIQVTLNDNRVFDATLVGADVNSDLALLKIEGDEFPIVPMGNSDDLKLGEWVLAVGNPFNLTSSVTAGVVSAKSRRIGIYDAEGSIESFIQTDAAINMGNSGGALVNVNGELVGINAALESPTGTYAGYGFAIPTTIVKKVVADLKEYGSVQRAILGIIGRDLSAILQLEENKNKDFGSIDGVYIVELTDGGGALAAGIEEGDVITAIDGKKVKTMTELQETIVQYRPGDKVTVTLLRNKKEKKIDVELKNSRGNTDIVKEADMEVLGAVFQEVPDQTRRQLNIGYGMQVSNVKNGLMKDAGIQKGYIILKINNKQIKSVEDIEVSYKEASDSPDQVLFITGVYPNGRRANYAVNLSEE